MSKKGASINKKRLSVIRKCLEKLYKKYNHYELIKPDPLQFVYRYSKKRDMEVAGFLASSLAYGRVQQIEKSVTNLLEKMGKSPYEFISNFKKSDGKCFNGFKHRFNTANDIINLIELLRDTLREYGSIEKYFLSGFDSEDKNCVPALSKFCQGLIEIYENEQGRKMSQSLSYLLCDPANGSTCKRMFLFLKWMVRDDDVDAGLWKGVDSSKLIVPMDVHMTRLCKILGLYNRKTVNLKTAVEVTKEFAKIEPGDPAKYDFALSRIGIIEDCNGKYRLQCENCQLYNDFCMFGFRN